MAVNARESKPPKLVAEADDERVERIGLSASAPGRSIGYVLTSDYAATVACAVGMAELVLGDATTSAARGVRFLYEVFSLAQLEARITDVIIAADRGE